jgi:hypothetical protein
MLLSSKIKAYRTAPTPSTTIAPVTGAKYAKCTERSSEVDISKFEVVMDARKPNASEDTGQAE